MKQLTNARERTVSKQTPTACDFALTELANAAIFIIIAPISGFPNKQLRASLISDINLTAFNAVQKKNKQTMETHTMADRM